MLRFQLGRHPVDQDFSTKVDIPQQNDGITCDFIDIEQLLGSDVFASSDSGQVF